MAKPADRLRGLAMSPHTTMDEAAMLKNCGRLLDEAERDLQAALDIVAEAVVVSDLTDDGDALVNRMTATLAKLRGKS